MPFISLYTDTTSLYIGLKLLQSEGYFPSDPLGFDDVRPKMCSNFNRLTTRIDLCRGTCHCPEAISKRMIQCLSRACPEISIWVPNNLNLRMLKKASYTECINSWEGSQIFRVYSFNVYTVCIYSWSKSGQCQVDGRSWWMWRAELDNIWLSSSTNLNTLWNNTIL